MENSGGWLRVTRVSCGALRKHTLRMFASVILYVSNFQVSPSGPPTLGRFCVD